MLRLSTFLLLSAQEIFRQREQMKISGKKGIEANIWRITQSFKNIQVPLKAQQTLTATARKK